jgi:hypothetical protein
MLCVSGASATAAPHSLLGRARAATHATNERQGVAETRIFGCTHVRPGGGRAIVQSDSVWCSLLHTLRCVFVVCISQVWIL